VLRGRIETVLMTINKIATTAVFTLVSLITIYGCGALKEKASTVNTSTNTEIFAKFETDTAGGLKVLPGCYPNYANTAYDYSDASISYQLKISSSNYVQVCLTDQTVGTSWSISNLTGKKIKFYATNTDPSGSEGVTPSADVGISINGTGGETSFAILGSGTCSWVTGGTLVGELDMTNYQNYKYIMIVDPCNKIAGSGMSPYEKSRTVE